MSKVSIALLIAASFALPQAAHAYSDITSASYMSQIILGTIFGGVVSIKTLPSLVADLLKIRRSAR